MYNENIKILKLVVILVDFYSKQIKFSGVLIILMNIIFSAQSFIHTILSYISKFSLYDNEYKEIIIFAR